MSQQQMTKYTADVPDQIWREWKETVPRSLNLNDGLVLLLARTVLNERSESLSEQQVNDIKDVIENIESKR